MDFACVYEGLSRIVVGILKDWVHAAAWWPILCAAAVRCYQQVVLLNPARLQSNTGRTGSP
ncbi:MAG: hypothetical protein JWN25_1286 [Verrucomicrobiales bacterium]|nr:hypothetical protein [Verrucomicrobiales bacterium]